MFDEKTPLVDKRASHIEHHPDDIEFEKITLTVAPSTRTAAPVIADTCSDATNTHLFAISSTVSKRGIDEVGRTFFKKLGLDLFASLVAPLASLVAIASQISDELRHALRRRWPRQESH
ncbi:hypothetical protein RMSM_06753 [Rhodopirellula maiorica SM1]|uniref:Uncharacterized protein n=1 Tax=Rhodopirellula maiorica SM1 TaxID=1265738 RepID=M5RQX5_9BACT|nr:hypothetical protein [Rhodopirellula maiorica]EMI16349.1 hypothetical protein RMSM_06753 [Rhodopirellula maiorica SM1]